MMSPLSLWAVTNTWAGIFVLAPWGTSIAVFGSPPNATVAATRLGSTIVL